MSAKLELIVEQEVLESFHALHHSQSLHLAMQMTDLVLKRHFLPSQLAQNQLLVPMLLLYKSHLL